MTVKLRTMHVLALALALGAPSAIADQPSLSPRSYEPQVADVVAKLLHYQHYSNQPLDDEIAARWFDGYIDSLDPQRMYFLQSDVDSFRKRWKGTLTDTAGQPSGLVPPTKIYELYTERVQQRIDTVSDLLDLEIDLTLDEDWQPDRTDLSWPATHDEITEIWRQRIKSEILAGELNKQERAEKIKLLRKRYQRFEEAILETESADVLEIWLSALSHSFDPHSVYWKPASSDNFDIDMSNSVEGIGAVLQSEDEFTVIKEIVVGGPADMDARLGAGDKIIAVAQGEGETVDILDMRLDKVVKQIRGKKGSTVNLTVIPAGKDMSEAVVIDIVRDRVLLSERDAEAEIHEVNADNGASLKVGVIDVPSFYFPFTPGEGQDVSDDVRQILADLNSKNVDGVVLDLRENGGGGLGEAVDIAGMFLDSGPMVQVQDRDHRVETLADRDRGTLYDGPLVVLTSPLSASASEIVAGAIQDYGRGLIIGGKTTHGKGTVQRLIHLDQMLPHSRSTDNQAGTLKITTQKFYRVSGGSTQSKGVESDIQLPSEFDGLGFAEADLDYPLPWDEIGKARFRRAGDVSDMLPALQATSEKRVALNEDFQKLEVSLHERELMMNQETFSLNLEKRRQEREEREARLGIEDEHPTLDKDGQPIAMEDTREEPPDPVLDETLLILKDYITLLDS